MRRKPSLSASRMATSAHSGMSSPSRKQIDADQHVERAEPQVADDLDALDGVDVGMHVAHADAVLVQILGQLLGHALGEHRDQDAVALLRHSRALRRRDRRPECAPGARRPEDRSGRSGGSPARRTRRRIRLSSHGPGVAETHMVWRPHRVPLLESQRAVVHAGGQAETIFGQRRLARGSRRDTCRRAAEW